MSHHYTRADGSTATFEYEQTDVAVTSARGCAHEYPSKFFAGKHFCFLCGEEESFGDGVKRRIAEQARPIVDAWRVSLMRCRMPAGDADALVRGRARTWIGWLLRAFRGAK